MREQHETKLLEQAIRADAERREAPARELKAASERLTQKNTAETHTQMAAADADAQTALIRAQAYRTVLVLLAASVLVVAVGFAVWLVLDAERNRLAELPPPPKPETLVGMETMPEEPKTPDAAATPDPVATPPSPVWPGMPEPKGTVTAEAGKEEEECVVTTNFTLFRETKMTVGGKTFFINAGHHFNKGTDTQFERAWCYTNRMVDGVMVNIDLGDKLPAALPVIDKLSISEFRKIGLSPAEHRRLFNACPWLDGNPDLSGLSRPDTIKPA